MIPFQLSPKATTSKTIPEAREEIDRMITAIFIDDALVNVEAANALGIRGIHLRPGQDIEQLGL